MYQMRTGPHCRGENPYPTEGICNGSLAQQWAVASSSSGFHLVNRFSGLCLDARGGAANGTPVEQWTYDWISNENWSWGNGRMSGQVLESGVSGTYNHCVSSPGEWTWFVQDVYLQSCNGHSFSRPGTTASPEAPRRD